jgi:hypothetical protein
MIALAVAITGLVLAVAALALTVVNIRRGGVS